MGSPSPMPSTPMSGVSLRGKWTFDGTPEDGVRKKLFELEVAAADDNELNQWSSSSEYFSQSANDVSCLSDTNLFDESSQKPTQELSLSLLTPNTSPTKRGCHETPPPLLKRQRLFSPSSPATPDKFPARFHSPAHPSRSPRPFLDSSCDSITALNEMAAYEADSNDIMMLSPPRLERLQLLDYPRTPLSIARSSGLQFPSANDSPREGRCKHNSHAGKALSRIKRHVARSGPELVRYQSRGTNINPFTPAEQRDKASPGGGRTSLFVANSEPKPHKRLALRESNISRYREEFHEVCVVGSGSFGTVYKCINRLDGCVYALKRSHKPVAGSADEASALREVCAHAVLGSHPHLVRYYSAWAEDNHMLIQNEFCDGGNLSSRITAYGYQRKCFGEIELQRLLKHVTMGLQYIHSMGLVHLDIKPENIFISSLHDPLDPAHPSMEAISEDNVVMEGVGQQFVYKIGDMGHVTSTTDPHVEEGDCRYLPREILQDNYSHLPKADVFSLGLTVLHAGLGADPPKNGEQWHKIRDGNLPPLLLASPAFNKLLQVMVHPNPTERPTASELLTIICPTTLKSKAQLCKELNEEKFKNGILQRELEVALQQSAANSSNDKKNLNGPRLNRSMSIT